MLINVLARISQSTRFRNSSYLRRYYGWSKVARISAKPQEQEVPKSGPCPLEPPIIGQIFPTTRVIPMVLTKKEPIVLPFDDVPGPKSLKLLGTARSYLSEIGTQLTANILTFGFNFGKLNQIGVISAYL